MKAGRSKDNAVLRTIAGKKNLNFATKRILRDLREIEDEKIPTVGVSARPLENSLFEWHANIQGPPGTIYEGGVFHLQIKLPESYPHQPPSIHLFTPLPHENVFGQNICLDMLLPFRGGESQGWSSGYSIQSILLQLQSFLFQESYQEDEQKFLIQVKKGIQDANNFKCRQCKHGGKLSAWPEFNPHEKEEDEDFVMADFNENKQFGQEILCYHTKLSFKDIKVENNEDLKGVAIGVGLKITKVPRTGAIQNVIPTLDYISIKAFIKEGIRWSVNNEKFSHFLPLYFGEEDNKERALHLGRKSLAMIMANNTRRFKPEFILQVFPKILVYQIFLIVEQKRHPSVLMIRQLAHIHANFLMFLEQYPELYDQIEKELQDFIKDESKRNKDHTPNLAVLLAYLLVCPKTKFTDLVDAYHNESLDRQVFWIFRSVPELADEENLESLNVERASLTFKCQLTSNQIFCLFKHYIQIVRGIADTPKQMLQFYEKNYSKLPNKYEDQIQKGAFHIFENVNTFDEFYKFLDLKVRTLKELNESLKQAIFNSKAKKYHGALEQIHTLPTSEDQIKALLAKIPKIEDFYEIKSVKQEEKKEFKFEIKKKREFTNDDWKQACLKRWSWIREAIHINGQLSATEVAELSVKLLQQGGLNAHKTNNRLFDKINEDWKNQKIEQEKPKIDFPEHNWEQVFCKLDLEDTLIYFDENPDFQNFYEKLEVMKDKVIALTIPLVNIKNVKSGYHYLTQVLSKLNLQHLELSGLPEVNNSFTLKAIKCVHKGLMNFVQDKRSLRTISFYNFNVCGNQNEITDKIFSPLQQMKELVSIRFQKNNLVQMSNAAKSLGNMITSLKNLQELIMKDGIFSNAQQAKEIADGLMRAKKLKYVDISKNPYMSFSGLSALIYNLAFATNLYSLNVSNQSLASPGNISDVVEALFKLLKINSSLELLDLSNVNGLNPKLTKDFFVHLGDIRTLRSVNFNNSGKFAPNTLADFGKAIAFNAKREGVLEYVDLTSTLSSFDSLTTFYKSMQVSEYDHELWYGDSIKAGKMSGSDHDKKFYNNLKALQLNNNYTQNYFSLADFQKYNRKDPEFVKLIATSPQLTSLHLSSASLIKHNADLLSLALDPTRENFASKIQVLDLSKNHIGKEGAKIIGSILEKNNLIEVLDLSKNKIGVSGAQALAHSLKGNKSVKFLNLFNNGIGFDGAKAFAETFAENTVLEFVEFGHNRIRDRGLLELGEGIAKNKDSKVQVLGLRFNFFREDGIIGFLKTVRNSKALKELYIKNNSINEYGLFQLKKAFDNIKSDITVDIFEKLQYLDEELLERTIYVYPVPGTSQEIKTFFQKVQHCGIVMDIRIRKGPKWPNRTSGENKFAMIEFADATSVTRALTVASRKKSMIGRTRFKIYKAGTGTFIYQKKTSKQKKAETSKTNILAVDSCTHSRMWDKEPSLYTIPDRKRTAGGARTRRY